MSHLDKCSAVHCTMHISQIFLALQKYLVAFLWIFTNLWCVKCNADFPLHFCILFNNFFFEKISGFVCKDLRICLKRILDLFARDLQPSWWCVRCNVDSWQRCTTSSNDAISGRCKEWCEKADVKYMHYCRVWYRFLLERDLIYFCELLCNC